MVERTIRWLKGLRRLWLQCDRLGVIMDAWATLAARFICFRILDRADLQNIGFVGAFESRFALGKAGAIRSE